MADNPPEHARLAAAIGAELHEALDGKRSAVFTSHLRIRIDATKRSTFCGPEQTSELDPNAITNPSVIVEVLSPPVAVLPRAPLRPAR